MILLLDARAAEVRLPPEVTHSATARAFVASIAATAPGFDPGRIDDVRLAVSEAVTNAITAHQRTGSDAPVVVRCAVTEGVLVVEVTDRGGGMVAPDGRRLDVSDLPDRGLGIPLMRSLADEVVFVGTPGGTLVRLAFAFRIPT